jgi:hypothetical protein
VRKRKTVFSDSSCNNFVNFVPVYHLSSKKKFSLCNACGLSYSKKLQREKKKLQKDDVGSFDSPGGGAE